MIQQTEPEQVLQNLTKFQATELLKQKMSDGFDWNWQYKTGYFDGGRQCSFVVTVGCDGRVDNITDVYFTEIE